MSRYVALLRGVNVGGRNLIRMTELKACFEAHGFRRVATYIQSGNVLFESRDSSPMLARRIEDMLAATFNYRGRVALRTREQLRHIASRAPEGFGTRPEHYRDDVLFLMAPLTASVAIKGVPIKAGVDRVYAGTAVLYFSRLIRRASQSRLSRIVSMPIYQNVTIRSWRTTISLLQMMDGP